MKKTQLLKTIIFFSFATIVRLIPHPPNFGLMGGFSAWSGDQSQKSNSFFWFIAPLALMFGTDLYLGLHDQIPGVYAGYAGVFILGRMFNLNSFNLTKTFMGSIALAACSTLTFFAISNAWVWYTTYTHSISTLLECYTMALPFIGNSFLGDLVAIQLFFMVPKLLAGSPSVVKTR